MTAFASHTRLFALSAALLLGAGSAWAQDTAAQPATETPAAEKPAEDAAKPDSALSMGKEVADGPTTYVREEVGDWQIQCLRIAEGQKETCHLYQLLKDAEGNSVAEASFFRLPKGGKAVAGATIIAPLETALTQALAITVDGGKAKRYPFSFCNPIGCYARLGFTQADIDAFKKGAKATVTVVPFAAPNTKVDLSMSLTGFTDGIAKADEITQ